MALDLHHLIGVLHPINNSLVLAVQLLHLVSLLVFRRLNRPLIFTIMCV